MPQRLDPESSRRKLSAKQKQEKAVSMRVHGHTWQEIADAVGYSAPANAYKAVDQYFAKVTPTPDIDHYRVQENLKLDELEKQLWGIINRGHVVIQHGKIVGRFAGWATDPSTGEVLTDKDDKPIATYDEIEDDEPVLRAVAQLLQVYARRAKLNGLDKPIVIKFENEDELDDEIEELVAGLNANLVGPPPGHEG